MSLFILSIVPGTALAQESVWTDMAPATGPSARGAHDMAYDSESDRVVLFGGGTTGFVTGFMDDTWTYDINANTWTDMNPGNRPSPRDGHAMAYDVESDRVILFGGRFPRLENESIVPSRPETWAYDANANTWTNMSPVIQPAAWYFVGMAYDDEADRMVLFGGCAGDSLYSCSAVTRDETWIYDYNANSWTNLSPGTRPAARLIHRMAYDAESDRVVLFGGILGTRTLDVASDTWAYNLSANSWTEMNPKEAPSRGDVRGMAYDANADLIILFGGFESSYISDTWAYDFDSDTWIRTHSGRGPSPRAVPRLVYDTESDRIVLFGGGTGTGFDVAGSDETWAHQLVPPPPPPPLLFYIAIGVVAAAVVAVVGISLTRRARRSRKGGGGE
jgi:N-acetylneuraminic acid mutarotase